MIREKYDLNDPDVQFCLELLIQVVEALSKNEECHVRLFLKAIEYGRSTPKPEMMKRFAIHCDKNLEGFKRFQLDQFVADFLETEKKEEGQAVS